jgi:putative ABC transport system substrate-binding protein
MKRREFMTLLGGATATWPVVARGQQADRMRRVGALITGVGSNPLSQGNAAAFREGLEKLGWIDGRNIKIEFRWGNSADQLRNYAAELASMNLDVILAGYASALARLRETIRNVPIIFANVPDPVGNGFVASVAHPGGNITGFANYEQDIGAKWLELLKQIAPNVTRVAYIYDPANPATAGYLRAIEGVASSMGVAVSGTPVRTVEEVEGTLGEFSREPNGAVIIAPGPATTAHLALIIGLAERYRLPSILQFREFVQAGALASYGVDSPDLFWRATS